MTLKTFLDDLKRIQFMYGNDPEVAHEQTDIALYKAFKELGHEDFGRTYLKFKRPYVVDN